LINFRLLDIKKTIKHTIQDVQGKVKEHIYIAIVTKDPKLITTTCYTDPTTIPYLNTKKTPNFKQINGNIKNLTTIDLICNQILGILL